MHTSEWEMRINGRQNAESRMSKTIKSYKKVNNANGCMNYHRPQNQGKTRMNVLRNWASIYRKIIYCVNKHKYTHSSFMDMPWQACKEHVRHVLLSQNRMYTCIECWVNFMVTVVKSERKARQEWMRWETEYLKEYTVHSRLCIVKPVRSTYVLYWAKTGCIECWVNFMVTV